LTFRASVADDVGVRICHIITRLILGGAQENTLLTCEGLAARGHDVTLITGPALGPEGELMSRTRTGDYRVVVLDAMRRDIRLRRDWQSYRRLKGLLGKLHPDVVHTHSSKAGILGRRAAATVGGTKIVHTIHGLPFHPYAPWWRNRLYVALERRAARDTDAIISVADAMTAQALAVGVGRPEQYTTIYSGMEVDAFTSRPPESDAFRDSLGVPEGAVLVTQVSRLAELKGHADVLAAVEQLDDRVHVCFVGDGRLRRRIAKRIARRGLTGRVHLTGLLPPDRIPTVMHAADIVVHCSLREGLARALPHAMLAGKPVVSYDVDGAREVVSDRTGVLVPPGDVAGLVEGMRRLAEDAGLRDRLGTAGRATCMERFDHRRMVERIEAVYRELL